MSRIRILDIRTENYFLILMWYTENLWIRDLWPTKPYLLSSPLQKKSAVLWSRLGWMGDLERSNTSLSDCWAQVLCCTDACFFFTLSWEVNVPILPKEWNGKKHLLKAQWQKLGFEPNFAWLQNQCCYILYCPYESLYISFSQANNSYF